MPPRERARREQLFEVWIRTLPQRASAHVRAARALREVEKLVEHGMTREQFELTRDS